RLRCVEHCGHCPADHGEPSLVRYRTKSYDSRLTRIEKAKDAAWEPPPEGGDQYGDLVMPANARWRVDARSVHHADGRVHSAALIRICLGPGMMSLIGTRHVGH